MSLVELQLDRLVGPTHHFGGLGVGNLASQQNAGKSSNPAAAALQGLEKMRMVAAWTQMQLVTPPQRRPDFQLLRGLGFSGTNQDVLKQALEIAPQLLSAATGCSAMWTANAATISPASDSINGHFNRGDQQANLNPQTELTVANLISSIHRTTEPAQTLQDLRTALPPSCRVTAELPGGTAMRDEGAANHMRLGTSSKQPGIHLFVYGDGDPAPTHHQPRQSRAACEAIARRHRLPDENIFFLKQHPDAIDAGAFHNDVVAMSHQDRLIHHATAFIDADAILHRIEDRYQQLHDRELIRIAVPAKSLSLKQAVATYLFNSQIISTPCEAAPRIICTRQVEQEPAARKLVETWCGEGVFESIHYVDLDQSMSGGGGPACLRLRVPVSDSLIDTIPSCSRLTEAKYELLRTQIERDYATDLTIEDLARVDFHQHAIETQQKLARILTTNN